MQIIRATDKNLSSMWLKMKIKIESTTQLVKKEVAEAMVEMNNQMSLT
jgi:hypothetical protein